VEQGVKRGNFLNFSIFVLGWVQHARVLDLLAPSNAFLLINSLHELLESFSLLLRLCILDDFDHYRVFLRDFDFNWRGIVDLNTEDFVALLLIIHITLRDVDHDLLELIATFECQCTCLVDVVLAWSCCAV